MFAERPGSDQLPYDRLIGAALDGDAWLFARQDSVEAAWQVVDPILGDVTPVHPYAKATWGPRRPTGCCPPGTCGTTRPEPGRTAEEGTMADQGRRRVVIVGGGFAGLFAARALRRAPVSVTLIDRAEHHLFQPLLYQCATGILSEGKIAAPLRQVLKKHRNVECVLAEVTGIDAAAHTVQARRPLGEVLEFGYDDLILAAGVRQSYFGHDEFRVLAPGMKTIEDALTIRRRVFGAFEMAESATSPAESTHWLTFVLVGAGPTGVELAGQIREVATKTLRAEYRHISPQDARVVLVDGGQAPLASFGPELSGKAAAALRKLGVELHMGSIVTKVDPYGVEVRDKDGKTTRHDAGTVLWTAGVEAPPLAAWWPRRPGRAGTGAAGSSSTRT